MYFCRWVAREHFGTHGTRSCLVQVVGFWGGPKFEANIHRLNPSTSEKRHKFYLHVSDQGLHVRSYYKIKEYISPNECIFGCKIIQLYRILECLTAVKRDMVIHGDGSHIKTMLPTRKSVPRYSRQFDHMKTS